MKRRVHALPVFVPQAQTVAGPLAVSNMRAWRLREPDSGRRYTMVRVETQSGAAGFGECGAVKSEDLSDAKGAIRGIRPTAHEFVRSRLSASPALEAGINNAFVDLMARASAVPVYQYLGGPVRFKCRLLARLPEGAGTARDTALEHARQRGFRMFTLAIPPREAMTRLQSYTDLVRKQLQDFQKAAGSGAEVVMDAGGNLLPGDAAMLARALEPSHPVWLDEPTRVLSSDALSRITGESLLPVGIGREIHQIGVFQDLLRWGCVDVLRPSLALNSLHKIRRMAAIAETHYIPVAPHHDGGPLATQFGIHLAASLSNAYVQEVPVPASPRDHAMRAELLGGVEEKAQDGFAPLINRPGLGLQISLQALTKYGEEIL